MKTNGRTAAAGALIVPGGEGRGKAPCGFRQRPPLLSGLNSALTLNSKFVPGQAVFAAPADVEITATTPH